MLAHQPGDAAGARGTRPRDPQPAGRRSAPPRSASRPPSKWKDREGQPAEATEWHRIAVYGGAVKAVEAMVRKGAALLVEGRVATREYDATRAEERAPGDRGRRRRPAGHGQCAEPETRGGGTGRGSRTLGSERQAGRSRMRRRGRVRARRARRRERLSRRGRFGACVPRTDAA